MIYPEMERARNYCYRYLTRLLNSLDTLNIQVPLQSSRSWWYKLRRAHVMSILVSE